ncbi:unnamed protein product [Ambrosiozyma monospora]|uniref:Unnamed protein product n=1 Tax=Ambrosiozyma monospora TaxID=43982 RepID=A0ACB5T677_AMBMO|nr:unnamed protein product [Ambrosiozyma monospora]
MILSTIIQELSKRDSCSGKNSDSQMCETGSSTSTTTIVCATVIPVCALAIGLGFMGWKAYKRNKEEALDDDNPDFNGENTVLPDYPALDDLKGGPYYNNSANNSANPFEGPNEKYARAGMDTASNFSQPKLGGAGNVRASRVESFVLPFAEETHSKHSLEILSKQLVMASLRPDPLIIYPKI